MSCRTCALVAVRPQTVTAAALDAPSGSIDELRRYRHEQWMANKERRWCALPAGHTGDHEFTLADPVAERLETT
jgi:hypothetical protein